MGSLTHPAGDRPSHTFSVTSAEYTQPLPNKDHTGRNKIVYLHYWPAMIDEKGALRKELTWDGLHPNDAGYEVMGRLAEKAVSEALKQKE